MWALLDVALLQLLCLLKLEQSRFECIRKIVYRSAESMTPLKELSAGVRSPVDGL